MGNEVLATVWLWIQTLSPYAFNVCLVAYLLYTNKRMKELEKKIAPFEWLLKKGCKISIIHYSDKENDDSSSED